MRYLRVLITMMIVAGLMAVASSSASATEISWTTCSENAGKGQWENSLCTHAKTGGNWETKTLTETVGIASSAEKLELVDLKAEGKESDISCNETDKGWAGSNGHSGISAATFTECESKTGVCGTGKKVTVVALNFPWPFTVLRRGSGAGPRIIFSWDYGKGVGYKVECTETKVKYECQGQISSRTEELSGTVAAVFGKVPPEESEVESPKQECSLGGAESGEIRGKDIFKLESGHGLFL
jgi:hypothetical protein